MIQLAEISAYTVVLTIHIAAVVVAFGLMVVRPIMQAVAEREGGRALPYFLRADLELGRTVVTPAMVVVLLAGIYLVIDGPWSFADPWIGATFAILFVLFGLAGGFFPQNTRRMLEAVEPEGGGEGQPAGDYRRASALQARIGALSGLLVLVAIFLMVAKPGA